MTPQEWATAIAFRHDGPGGDAALEAAHPTFVQALKSMLPGDSRAIIGVAVTRHHDGTWDVGDDRHLASPWVVVQSLRSVLTDPVRSARTGLLGRWEQRLRAPRDELGYTAVELLLMTTLLMGFIITVVGAGRFVDASSQVDDAAYAAARAASLEQNIEAGQIAGREAAQSALAERGKACTRLTVSFAGTDFRTSGHVKVEVTCHANLSDVVGFGLPGAKDFTATAVVPIEQYRRLS